MDVGSITECSVCLETFSQDGDRVPKLLPCSHTLCLGCLMELVKGPKVDCPECRQEHRLSHGAAGSFPSNRYGVCVCVEVCVQERLRACV